MGTGIGCGCFIVELPLVSELVGIGRGRALVDFTAANADTGSDLSLELDVIVVAFVSTAEAGRPLAVELEILRCRGCRLRCDKRPIKILELGFFQYSSMNKNRTSRTDQ